MGRLSAVEGGERAARSQNGRSGFIAGTPAASVEAPARSRDRQHARDGFQSPMKARRPIRGSSCPRSRNTPTMMDLDGGPAHGLRRSPALARLIVWLLMCAAVAAPAAAATLRLKGQVGFVGEWAFASSLDSPSRIGVGATARLCRAADDAPCRPMQRQRSGGADRAPERWVAARTGRRGPEAGLRDRNPASTPARSRKRPAGPCDARAGPRCRSASGSILEDRPWRLTGPGDRPTVRP